MPQGLSVVPPDALCEWKTNSQPVAEAEAVAKEQKKPREAHFTTQGWKSARGQQGTLLS